MDAVAYPTSGSGIDDNRAVYRAFRVGAAPAYKLVVIGFLDYVRARGLPAPALRVRLALDIVDRATLAAGGVGSRRVTLADVNVDAGGRARAPACASPDHLATLLWEVLAGRAADTEELPWADPADDLPAEVLDAVASLSVRPARTLGELRQRFIERVGSHGASHDDVLQILTASAAPACTHPTPVVARDPSHITLRAPPLQMQALRTLSADEASAAPPSPAPAEDLITTRVCPAVTLASVLREADDEPSAIAGATTDVVRSTMEPWHAAVPADEPTPAATAEAGERAAPRRRTTWPIVAACMAAALALLVVAGQRRSANDARANGPSAQEPSPAEVVIATPAGPIESQPTVDATSGQAAAQPQAASAKAAAPTTSANAERVGLRVPSTTNPSGVAAALRRRGPKAPSAASATPDALEAAATTPPAEVEALPPDEPAARPAAAPAVATTSAPE